MRQASLSFTIAQTLLELTSIESVMPSNHLVFCHPLFLLLSILPSIRVFSSESVLHIRWPKYWSFSFSINPSNEYSGLISFRMDWLDLLAGRSLDILMRSLDLLSLSLRVFSGTTVQKHQVFDSSTLSFLYSPTLTSVHDSCKNHRLDYTHHYQQNNVFAF